MANSGGGGVDITDTSGGLTVGSVTTDGVAIAGVSTVGGGVTLVANSPLTINEAVADTGGGDITLTASGTAAADDLTLAANVTASGGDGTITLNAGDAILQTAGTVSAAGAGTITYNAATGTTTGVLTMSSGTQIISATGTIDLNADGDIQLAQIDTTSGNVTVTGADGSVTLLAGGRRHRGRRARPATMLEADAGIRLNDVLTTVAGSVQIDADVDNASGGTLTTGEAGTISTGGGTVSITADDVALSGTINSGVASTTIIDSDGTGIGLGGTSVGLDTFSRTAADHRHRPDPADRWQHHGGWHHGRQQQQHRRHDHAGCGRFDRLCHGGQHLQCPGRPGG